jgi:hypothetical protein
MLSRDGCRKRAHFTSSELADPRAGSTSDMAINEMVRRRLGLRLGSLHREKHHMRITSIGIDLGKATFHLVAFRRAEQDSGSQEVLTCGAADVYREPARIADQA